MSKVIGIDLGTTNSCVAVVEGGKPVVITNAEGERTTPSVVAFTKDGERLVGGAAKRQIATNSGRTVTSIKRHMGSDYRVHIDGKDLTPQEISAMILAKIRRDAESYLGEPVTEAVITVPAYFAGFSQLLRDGADFRKIDKVMEKQFGWPMGPAYLLDVVGIDTAHHAQAVMTAGFPQRMQKDYRDAIDALFDANRFGQKNGLGFWRYKEDSKGKPKKEEDAVVDDLLAEVSQPKRDFSEEEIIARMMIPMVNEVVRCLEEGIIASPAEADMALVYGLGFPPFHGGAFRWLDTLGSAKYLDMAQQYQHLGPMYEVPEGLRNKARHNEPYYPPVEPARPVGDLKTA